MSFSFHLPVLCDGTSECGQLTGDDPDLCSESYILENPSILTQSKQQSVQNGATVVLAPTAGANHSRLIDLSMNDEFIRFNSTLTELTVQSVESDIPVGGTAVPSKLYKPPYTRNIFEEAYFQYLEKFTLLKDNGATFIMMKNQNNLWDMRAGVLAAQSLELPIFVTMNVDEDGKNTNGTDYMAALITLQSIGADAFGIFCTDDIDAQSELLKDAFPHAEIPLIAVIQTETASHEQLTTLSNSGASVFIDLSCWSDASKTAIFQQMVVHFDASSEKDSYAAAINCEAFFLPDNLDLSEPLDCGYDMSEEMIDLDDENINAVYIPLHSTDDAALLCENAAMTRLPIVIHTSDTVTLEAALRYYQGRLIVDTRCDIEPEDLERLSQKYGAILY